MTRSSQTARVRKNYVIDRFITAELKVENVGENRAKIKNRANDFLKWLIRVILFNFHKYEKTLQNICIYERRSTWLEGNCDGGNVFALRWGRNSRIPGLDRRIDGRRTSRYKFHSRAKVAVKRRGSSCSYKRGKPGRTEKRGRERLRTQNRFYFKG